ncbi:hypothetical protein [Risungbinella massiliensis]|uniref:hypothetical protein n=1 Tax=Risungbinella massiliensis TaxID=1329796 RepID=UPI0011C7E039|nr:hypothetical protein [Risungbinella massiliensis]
MRRRRRRALRLRSKGTTAAVNNSATVGSVSGLINIIVQVPVNLGDANAFDRIDGSATANNIL